MSGGRGRGGGAGDKRNEERIKKKEEKPRT